MACLVQIRQLFIDCYDCDGPLNDPDKLISAMESAGKGAGAAVLDRHACCYQPHGITAVVFLAESHVMITTWPEHNYATVEVFLCDQKMDPKAVWNALNRTLLPQSCRVQEITHGIPQGIQYGKTNS